MRSNKPCTTIPETVDVMGDFKSRFSLHFVRLQQIVSARRMDIEKRHHSYSRRNIELNVVCKADQHIGASKRKVTGLSSVLWQKTRSVRILWATPARIDEPRMEIADCEQKM